MPEKINVNGVISDAATAVVPAMDHGFLFGDSIYETLRTYGGHFFRFDAHHERLQASAASLQLTLPLTEEGFRERTLETLAAAEIEDASVRLVVTRGVGPMGLDPTACDSPNVLVFVRPRPRYPEGAYANGLSVAIVSRTRNHRASLDPNVKSGNYLNNVLALVEANQAGAFEAVMLNADGQVTEGSTSNLFIVKDGRVQTAPVSAGLLSGITRREVLACCQREGVELLEQPFGPEELRGADEVFITSALKQLMPITKVDGQTIGDGQAGEVSRRLLASYRQAVLEETGVAPEEDS
ncbi:MAG: D-amino acid aminotransferase [Acidobacteriota bacterium]